MKFNSSLFCSSIFRLVTKFNFIFVYHAATPISPIFYAFNLKIHFSPFTFNLTMELTFKLNLYCHYKKQCYLQFVIVITSSLYLKNKVDIVLSLKNALERQKHNFYNSLTTSVKSTLWFFFDFFNLL